MKVRVEVDLCVGRPRQLQQRFGPDPVDLVQHQDLRLAHVRQAVEDRVGIALDAALGVDQHQHDVGVLGAAPGGRDHRAVERGAAA